MLNNIDSFGMNVRLMIGVVEDVNDPIGLGRARVRFFGYHPESREEVPTTSLPWATVVAPTTSASNSGVGMSIQLLAGSWVLGFFADGTDGQFPWVIGTIPTLHRPNPPGYASGMTGDAESSSGSSTGSSDSGSDGTTSTSKPYHGNSNEAGGKQVNAANIGTINTSDTRVTHDNKANFKLKYYSWSPRPAGFACADGRLAMHWGTAQAFELLTSKLGKKLSITSAYRSPQYNSRLSGAAKNSMHTHGRAIDVGKSSIGDISAFIKAAVESGFVGFGWYPTFIHIDTGSGRTWGAWPAKYKNIMREAGWRPGQRGLTHIKNPPQAQNNPSSPAQSSTGSSKFGGPRLDGPSTTATPDYYKGFKDPTNSFPLLDYRGRVSTHFNTLGTGFRNVPNPHAMMKDAQATPGFSLPNNKGTFSQPRAPYAAQYPHNRTWNSLGHTIELDDTPNAERVNIQHKSGSSMEIDKNGTLVTSSTADSHNYAAMNSYNGAQGSHNIAANGEINTYAGTDRAEHTNGSCKIKIGNDQSVEISGEYSLISGEKAKIRTGKLYIEADEIHFTALSKLFMTSDGELNISGKTVAITGEDSIDISGKATKVTGTDSMDVKGNKTNIESKGKMNIKGENTAIGGAKVSLSGITEANIIKTNMILAGISSTGTGNPDAPDGAGEAKAAAKAQGTDLGMPSGLERTKLENIPNVDSTSLTRPSYASNSGYGDTGKVADEAGSSGQTGSGSAGYPSVPSSGGGGGSGGSSGSSGGSSSGSSGGSDGGSSGGSSDNDEKTGETYGEPSTPATGDNPSLFNPEGVKKYVDDFSVKAIKGGGVKKPSQGLIDGYVRASRETGFPLDLLYLYAAYESNMGNNTGNSKLKGSLQVGPAYAAEAKKSNPNANNSSDYGAALAVAANWNRQKKRLEQQIGRAGTRADAYLLHFQGPGGAPVIIKNAEDPNKRDKPIEPEGKLSSAAINNNQSEFFVTEHGKKRKRTWAEFYARQKKKFGDQSMTGAAKSNAGGSANTEMSSNKQVGKSV